MLWYIYIYGIHHVQCGVCGIGWCVCTVAYVCSVWIMVSVVCVFYDICVWFVFSGAYVCVLCDVEVCGMCLMCMCCGICVQSV